MKINIKKIYTIVLSLSLILDGYAFAFAKGISIAYLLLSLFLNIFFIDSIRKEKKVNTGFLTLIFLLVFFSLISTLIIGDNDYQINKLLIGSAKLMVLGITISLSNNYIDKNTLEKSIINISIVSTAYLFLQSILYYIFNISTPNGLSLKLIKFVGVDLSMFSSGYRPSSLFSEPAYYATYILISLSLILFEKNKTNIKNNKKLIIFLSLGIVLSTSTAGIYLLFLMYLLYFINYDKTNLKKFIITSILVIPLFIILCSNIEYILMHLGKIGEATLQSINKIEYRNSSSRLGGSFEYIKKIESKYSLFGYGIGNEYKVTNGKIRYFNSITRLFLQSGYIGIIAFTAYMVNLYKKTNSLGSKYIYIMYIIKCISGGAMFSITGFYMMSIMYFLIEKNSKRKE